MERARAEQVWTNKQINASMKDFHKKPLAHNELQNKAHGLEIKCTTSTSDAYRVGDMAMPDRVMTEVMTV